MSSTNCGAPSSIATAIVEPRARIAIFRVSAGGRLPQSFRFDSAQIYARMSSRLCRQRLLSREDALPLAITLQEGENRRIQPTLLMASEDMLHAAGDLEAKE